MNMEAIVNFVSTQGADFALKLLGALVAWVVGRWIISLAIKAFGAAMAAGKKIDATLANYLKSILGLVLNIILVLAVLDIFGVKTTNFAALLASAGLAIGAAWSGLLSHLPPASSCRCCARSR